MSESWWLIIAGWILALLLFPAEMIQLGASIIMMI
jgi:hypothetical protein